LSTDNKKVIGIIGAMESEVCMLRDKIGTAEKKTISGVDFYSGDLYGVKVVVAKCGIGKVFAAICAEAMILNYAPDMILNVGVAGSLADDLKLKDIAIAENLVQHDMDTSAIGDPVGLISGINIIYIPCDKTIVSSLDACATKLGLNHKVGTIASGDCFVSDSAKKKYIVDNFSAISCEMEGASIGHVCYVNNVPFGVIRAMSDNGDEEAGDNYMETLEQASNIAMSVIDSFLQSL